MALFSWFAVQLLACAISLGHEALFVEMADAEGTFRSYRRIEMTDPRDGSPVSACIVVYDFADAGGDVHPGWEEVTCPAPGAAFPDGPWLGAATLPVAYRPGDPARNRLMSGTNHSAVGCLLLGLIALAGALISLRPVWRNLVR